MSVTTWVETNPPNTEAASLGDDALRSVKVSIAEGLSTSMYWPGTGGGSAASAGIMKPGAARTFYGTQSQVSAAQQGQLMVTSDTSRLYYVGNTGPVYLGGQFGMECSANPGVGARWVMDSGSSTNGRLITFQQSYAVAPRVVLGNAVAGAISILPSVVSGVGTSGFTFTAYDVQGSAQGTDTVTSMWMSLGTVAV
jgi:hypothetical protein